MQSLFNKHLLNEWVIFMLCFSQTGLRQNLPSRQENSQVSIVDRQLHPLKIFYCFLVKVKESTIPITHVYKYWHPLKIRFQERINKHNFPPLLRGCIWSTRQDHPQSLRGGEGGGWRILCVFYAGSSTLMEELLEKNKTTRILRESESNESYHCSDTNLRFKGFGRHNCQTAGWAMLGLKASVINEQAHIYQAAGQKHTEGGPRWVISLLGGWEPGCKNPRTKSHFGLS